jgi:putative endonuclease
LNRLVWAERVANIEICITHEKRVKRGRREWKIEQVERVNPEWRDLSAPL